MVISAQLLHFFKFGKFGISYFQLKIGLTDRIKCKNSLDGPADFFKYIKRVGWQKTGVFYPKIGRSDRFQYRNNHAYRLPRLGKRKVGNADAEEDYYSGHGETK